MHSWGSAPTLLPPLLLLLLLPLGRVLEVGGSMREALAALDLPLEEDTEPQLQRNHTAVLISSLLRAVHCAEQTATSQDACAEVKAVERRGRLGWTLCPACVFVFLHPIPASDSKKCAEGRNVRKCCGLKAPLPLMLSGFRRHSL